MPQQNSENWTISLVIIEPPTSQLRARQGDGDPWSGSLRPSACLRQGPPNRRTTRRSGGLVNSLRRWIQATENLVYDPAGRPPTWPLERQSSRRLGSLRILFGEVGLSRRNSTSRLEGGSPKSVSGMQQRSLGRSESAQR